MRKVLGFDDAIREFRRLLTDRGIEGGFRWGFRENFSRSNTEDWHIVANGLDSIGEGDARDVYERMLNEEIDRPIGVGVLALTPDGPLVTVFGDDYDWDPEEGDVRSDGGSPFYILHPIFDGCSEVLEEEEFTRIATVDVAIGPLDFVMLRNW